MIRSEDYVRHVQMVLAKVSIDIVTLVIKKTKEKGKR